MESWQELSSNCIATYPQKLVTPYMMVWYGNSTQNARTNSDLGSIISPDFFEPMCFYDSWCVLISFLVVKSPGWCPLGWFLCTFGLISTGLVLQFLHVLFISLKKHGKWWNMSSLLSHRHLFRKTKPRRSGGKGHNNKSNNNNNNNHNNDDDDDDNNNNTEG